MACTYCVPDNYLSAQNSKGIINTSPLPTTAKSKERLSFPKLIEIVSTLHKELELSQVRLTGGEPLLHPELTQLIRSIKSLDINAIGLTSNGFLLALQAQKLKNAGLSSVNISIDAIDNEVFRKITRKNYLSRVLEGVDKALEVGLEVKLNAVIMSDVNHSQVIPLLRYAQDKGIVLRFIELMKMGHLYASDSSLFYSAEKILSTIENIHSIEDMMPIKSSTTRYWKLDNGQIFGIIANESFPFCKDCDRLRLDEYGRIYGCISSNIAHDISGLINKPIELSKKLKTAMATKQPEKFKGNIKPMIDIGG